MVGAFAVGTEEVASTIVTVAADLWRRRATHVPARRVLHPRLRSLRTCSDIKVIQYIRNYY